MEQDSALMRALAMAVHANPDLLHAFRELLIEPELEELRPMLQRAVDRGEIRADNPAIELRPAHDGRRLRRPDADRRPAAHTGVPHLVHRRRGPPRPRRLTPRHR